MDVMGNAGWLLELMATSYAIARRQSRGGLVVGDRPLVRMKSAPVNAQRSPRDDCRISGLWRHRTSNGRER
jgi:hypothetical protein